MNIEYAIVLPVPFYYMWENTTVKQYELKTLTDREQIKSTKYYGPEQNKIFKYLLTYICKK